VVEKRSTGRDGGGGGAHDGWWISTDGDDDAHGSRLRFWGC
jgi:hypothetical protein